MRSLKQGNSTYPSGLQVTCCSTSCVVATCYTDAGYRLSRNLPEPSSSSWFLLWLGSEYSDGGDLSIWAPLRQAAFALHCKFPHAFNSIWQVIRKSAFILLDINLTGFSTFFKALLDNTFWCFTILENESTKSIQANEECTNVQACQIQNWGIGHQGL